MRLTKRLHFPLRADVTGYLFYYLLQEIRRLVRGVQTPKFLMWDAHKLSLDPQPPVL